MDTKEKQRNYQRGWRKKNPNKVKEYKKRYKLRYPEKVREVNKLLRKRYRLRHPEKVREYNRKYVKLHPEKLQQWRRNRDIVARRISNRRHARNTRLKVLSFYSGGKLECNCCGEKEIKFLSLDHKNNDGFKCLLVNGRRASGSHLYKWVIKNGFPEIFQVLCYNCNLSKGFYGQCPHDVKK